ncbi:Hpt domain-containing protein [Photobacterium chitinilyticum]|uniref:Hpt domain-containing protein n=1 Tax=Photobacterium chitinilyticum TaxID=2485123 RepID=A0A444JUD2_9GAMM|nr:Hpt domain-containing protein [Photobacterium chitinilyticum]RWX56704.1 Hpt domain-containing protein [Photobacterium chitinilyticum]
MENKEKPVSDLAEDSSQQESVRLTVGRGNSLSSGILAFGLVLLLIGTGVIAYLSVLSASTLSFISSTSELQNEAEQLRWRIITLSADSSRPLASTHSELTVSFRSRLVEWQNGDIPVSAQDKMRHLVRQGRQFADQAEYAWLARDRFRYADNMAAIENVDINPFLGSLYQLQSSLVQAETKLTWLTLLLAVLVALTGFGGVSYGVGLLGRERREREVSATSALLVSASGGVVADSEKDSGLIANDAGTTRVVFKKMSVPTKQDQVGRNDTVLDTEQMLDSMDGDRESVVLLLDIFMKEHVGDAKRLSASLERGQYDEASLIAHSLKSVAGSFGAVRLRQRTEFIEHCCKQGIAISAEDIEQLDEALGELKAAILMYLAEEAETVEEDAVQIEEYTREEEATVVEPEDISDAELQPAKASSPKADEHLALLNVVYVLESMDDDVESVKMLLEIFIGEHALDAKRLQQLVYQCAPDEISETAFRLVHSLKGVASSLGAEALKRQAEVIESHFKQKQVVADSEYRKLASVLDDTIVAATRYLTQQAAVVA